MRGTQSRHRVLVQTVGIIPAYAGSTWQYTSTGRVNGDHPRGCGEHDIYYDIKKSSDGSSPRMRGAQAEGRGHDGSQGIIPADAGSTTPPGR